MQNHVEMNKLTKDFYEKYPEFKNDPDSVRSVIHMLEKDNVDIQYNDLLTKAVPLIKERMQQTKKLNVTDKKELNQLDRSISSNGIL